MIEVNFIQKRNKSRYTYILIGILLITISLVLVFNRQHHSNKITITPISESSLQASHQICKNKNCLLTASEFSELKLVGTLIGIKHQWAFISDLHHVLTKIQIGDIIGNIYMQVTQISSTFVQFTDFNMNKKQIILSVAS